jgi:hypothetical protein
MYTVFQGVYVNQKGKSSPSGILLDLEKRRHRQAFPSESRRQEAA